MTYRSELIQVAAVCVAMIQDIENGTTDLGPVKNTTLRILNEIHEERVKQETKWGPQHHSLEKWFTILGEEFGEVGRAILEGDI